MVQAIDHEAVDGDMDQEAVEGAVAGASDERSDRLQAMDHEAVKGDMGQEAVEGAIMMLSKQAYM